MALDSIRARPVQRLHDSDRVQLATLIDYLATWRVEEAKRQLLDPARDVVTIDAIAESSGFGSLSAFYSAFRRLTGVTPSEFRKSGRT